MLHTMFSKFLVVAFCAFSTVTAAPGCNGQFNVQTIGRTSTPATLSVNPCSPVCHPHVPISVAQNPTVVKLVNERISGSAFIFHGPGDLEVLIQGGNTNHGQDDWWYKWKVGEDRYVFQHWGAQGRLLRAGPNLGRLIVSDDTSFSSEFAVEPAGKNTFKIKLPGEDQVAAAVFDGSSPLYGRVALEKAGGPYEEWIIQEL
ncbi:hypothetical protein B0H11DRAFT_1251420 [Mycena galericulata]|nr:hypothetical protein B0H11DRAFT_1251420 [Mycena galericulata]